MSEMPQHPDPAEIAALDEELLPPAEEATLRAHIADCAACAETAAEFVVLRQHLRDLPLPRIPDDVATRIDAALGALHVSRETEPADESHAPALPSDEQPDTPGSADGGAEPVVRQPRPPAVRTEETDVGREVRGRRARALDRVSRPAPKRWPRFALAAAGAVLAVALGSTVLDSLGPTTHQDGGGQSEAADADAGQAADPMLEDQVRDLLAESEAAESLASPENATEPAAPSGPAGAGTEGFPEAPPGSGGETTGDEEGGLEVMLDVPTCVEDAIGRTEVPLAAEEEDYAGTDAYLVVFPHSVDPERVDAYVVDADCVSATPPVSGEVLVRASYPRD
ncbi:hypothetical protein [Streptomyces avicenniae]|uniref:hypothetical protein n=1 Tax=Streptomyces avicenniae TaxID=500153 RepID=UPI00069BF5C7|nr:hypothetical protein [Streptomyces avicenniae]